MVQLERIGATVERRQSLEGENKKKESKDEEESSENSLRESQEEGTPLSVSCQNSFFSFLQYYFVFL